MSRAAEYTKDNGLYGDVSGDEIDRVFSALSPAVFASSTATPVAEQSIAASFSFTKVIVVVVLVGVAVWVYRRFA